MLNHVESALPLSALYAYSGHESFSSFLGLGTLSGENGLAGELVILGGAAWLIDGAGNARKVKDPARVTTPFAMAVNFEPQIRITEQHLHSVRGMRMQQLTDYLDSFLYDRSKPHAARIYLPFDEIQLRSIRPGTRPGMSLESHTVVMDIRNMSYFLAGFWMPAGTPARQNFPGWHFHALSPMPSEEGQDGGHVNALRVATGALHSGSIEIQEIENTRILTDAP